MTRLTRQDEDEQLIKEIKTFENEVKFKITKCKNVRLARLIAAADAQGERERTGQADR